MSEGILVEEAGGVLRLTIDRQPRLNAIPATELDDQVDSVAARLAAGPRRALQLTKAAIDAATLTELDAAFVREKDGQIELLTSADFLEGMTAMLTRRAPNFTGAVHPVAEPA